MNTFLSKKYLKLHLRKISPLGNDWVTIRICDVTPGESWSNVELPCKVAYF